MVSALSVYRKATEALLLQQIPLAQKEALALLSYTLKHNEDPSMLFARLSDLYLDDTQIQAYESAVTRRSRREPLEHITGSVLFFNRRFHVTRDTLIPRPETELLADYCLQLLPDEPLHVLDLCCGSGCLGITLALARPLWTVLLCDISFQALSVCKSNQTALNAKTEMAQMDLMHGLIHGFDLIVCNPPYLPLGMKPSLMPEVRDHEPELALYGGEDGLSLIEKILPMSADALNPSGHLMMEIGHDQADRIIRHVMQTMPHTFTVKALPDFSGISRFLHFQKGSVNGS